MKKIFFLILIVCSSVFIFKSSQAATFNANFFDDRNQGNCFANSCSLREAVLAANALPNQSHTIILKSGQTYHLSIQGEDDTAEKGDLDLKGNITIQVDGNGKSIVDGGGQAGMRDRVFQILQGSTIVLNNLIIQNGYLENFTFPTTIPDPKTPVPDALPWGSGIHNSATLTLNNVLIQKNVGQPPPEMGNPFPTLSVGISNDATGKLTLNSSTVSEQTGEFGALGIANVKGEVILNNSTVSKNKGIGAVDPMTGAKEGGIGMGIATLAGKVTLNNTIVTENVGLSSGVGISNVIAELTLKNSIVSNNQGNDPSKTNDCYAIGIGSLEGKLITLENSKIINNKAIDGKSSRAYGISYINVDFQNQETKGEMNLRNIEISGNTGTNMSAGIYEDTAFDSSANNKWILEDTTVSGHQAYLGIGIHNPLKKGKEEWTVTNSTISNNFGSSNQGGGIDVSMGDWIIQNSTISSNQSPNGKVNVGLYIPEGNPTFKLIHDTITANYEGIAVESDSTASFEIKNTIIAKNKHLDCWWFERSQKMTSLGGNLRIRQEGCFSLKEASDIVLEQGVDPKLGDLADNGGPTQTHALLPDSPALNKIPSANCTDANNQSIVTDQRGVVRPAGDACDVGAFELATLSFAVNPTSLNFPLTSIGLASTPQAVTVTNKGDKFRIGSSILTGDQSNNFIISKDNCTGKTLDTNASCTVTIQLIPSSAGDFNAMLNIPISGGKVALTGKGTTELNLGGSPRNGGGGGGCSLSAGLNFPLFNLWYLIGILSILIRFLANLPKDSYNFLFKFKKIFWIFLFLSFVIPSVSFARRECREDRKKFCGNVQIGEDRVKKCLMVHFKELSEPCKKKIGEKIKEKIEKKLENENK